MTSFITDPLLGRIALPFLDKSVSLPGRGVRRAAQGEIGIFVMKHCRPRYGDDGLCTGFDLITFDVTHNERVDAGAQKQSKQVHGGGGTPGAPSATAYFQIIAVANAALTKAKGDQSLGTTSADVTTNEFTTIGLSRAAATVVGGNYTAPSTLGGTFVQVLTKTFTASGSGTAKGAGVFDSVTVSGSILYVEDNHTDAVLITNDTLTETVTITN